LLRALVEEGLIYMQDEASQLVAQVLGARAGERVLDACAAPGSKTTHMAVLAGDEASIVAGDRYAQRLRVVCETAARQGLESIRAVVYDAERALPFAADTFDRVLVDAPCTGTGTLRHNPEIRWRITPADIRELAVRQRRILDASARTLKPGGRLVYSTCSVEREENEEVVEAFLAEHEGFRQLSVSTVGEGSLTSTGAARTWPHRDDVDGFFVALFERTF
jgi:16S rRNA (cytosine967-C5)-methyltransferase